MKKIQRIFIAGGGGSDDSRLIDKKFAATLDHKKPLVYIPNAMNRHSYQSCLRWFMSVVNPLGITTIEMWHNLNPSRPIEDIGGIYVGGGDTVKLITEIRESGFDEYLLKSFESGIPLYGGSAGAIIFGEDIRLAPEAKRLEPTEAAGLRIINGYSVACHYRTSRERVVQRLAKVIGKSVIAIPEKSGGYIKNNLLTNFGTEPIVIFLSDKKILIYPGDSVKLK